MFKTTLSRAIDCACLVSVDGYEIDEFQGTPDGVWILECSGVVRFKLADAEIVVGDEADGLAAVSGWIEEGNDHWVPFDGFIEFSMLRPLVENDCV